MILAENNMVLPGVGALLAALSWVFLVSVPVAVVVAVSRSRRAARRDQTAPATAASVSLLLVRIWIGLFLLASVYTLIGADDRSLGDRLEFQEYGYTVPTSGGKVEEHPGPWLVLHHNAELRICPNQSRPYLENDPPVFAGPAVCPAAKILRKEFGDVDIDSLELVRQVERPAASVERHLNFLIWGGFACFLLGAVALERILRLTAQRRPFSSGAVTWLRVLAGAMAGAVIVIPALADRFVDSLVREYFTPAALEGMDAGVSINIGSVIVVLLILVLAEVWRFGIRLQGEADATV